MNKNKEANFFRVMGCIVWIIGIAIIIGLIVSVVNGFKNNVGAWPIAKDFLNILASCVVSFGVGELFFSYACLIEEDKYCAR